MDAQIAVSLVVCHDQYDIGPDWGGRRRRFLWGLRGGGLAANGGGNGGDREQQRKNRGQQAACSLGRAHIWTFFRGDSFFFDRAGPLCV